MFEVDRQNKALIPLSPAKLSELEVSERYDLQEWIDHHPAILGEELLVVAKELELSFGARLDLLAVDKTGALVVIELKRDDSGRNVDWQAIRYASYVANFTEEELTGYFADYLGAGVEEARERLGKFVGNDLDALNERQRIVLCAREFHSDVVSAVLWLRENSLDLSCVRIRPYTDGNGRLFIVPETIVPLPEAKDYVVRKERKEQEKKDRPPFSRYLLVNVGEGGCRNWDDNRKYGYLSAGDGRNWSKQIERLQPGDPIFAYLKGHGYVGYGSVSKAAVPIGEFIVESEGKLLRELPLVEPGAFTNVDDPELTEYAVAVDWIKTFPREEAKFFTGIFAHPSVVARMRQDRTVEFLEEAFTVDAG